MPEDMGLDTTASTAAPDKELKGIPSEGDSTLGKFLYGKFELAKKEKDRLNLHKKWMKNHELVRGKHFTATNSKWPLVPVNIFYVAVSRTKANLTDNKPRFEIVPHDESTEQHAPKMNAAAIAWWKRTKQQKTLNDTIHNSEQYGTTIEKSIFDPDKEGGIGDADQIVVDPFKFFPWPGIRDIQKMPRIFEVDIMELDEIKRRWVKTGGLVTADKQWSDLTGADRDEIKGGTLSDSKATGNLPNKWTQSGSAPGRDVGIQKAMVIECWMKDYSMQPIYEEQPVYDLPKGVTPEMYINAMGEEPAITGTKQVKTGEQPKYPGFIRVVHIANDGDVVLDDVPNPSINPNLPLEVTANTYLFDKYPYLDMGSNTDTSNFWSYSLIEQIEILGKEINKKVSQIAAYIDKTVRPTLINPANSGIEEHEISNLPGQTWRPTNHIVAQYIRYLQIPPLPSDFYKYLELLLKLVDILTGLHDVTQGRKPAGIAAASAIIALQEKAETMFREKIRNIDLLIEGRGMMWISHVQNWFSEQRTMRLSGKTKQLIGGPFTTYRGTDMQGEFTFEVVSGSTMPKSMWARREQSIQLFQNGVIDQKAILDEFDYPNRDEIIKRMQMGQLGVLLEKLQMAGVPPDILQVIQYVANLDDREFQKQFAQPPDDGGAVKGQPATQGGGKK